MKQIYTAEKRVSLFINKNQVALQGQKLAFQVEEKRGQPVGKCAMWNFFPVCTRPLC